MATSSKPVAQFPRIKNVKTFITQGVGSGGDYHNVKGGHWLIDSKISTPMSGYESYRASRTSWGINVLGSFCVELEATDGTKGFATGFGGPPACWLVKEHFERFIIGAGEHSEFSKFRNRRVTNINVEIPVILTISSNKCTVALCSTVERDSP
jgi:L-rhamnonate dehydratase